MNSSPLVKYPDINVVLPPVYCGSVRYYAAMAQYGAVTIDITRRFNKRDKDCQRWVIECHPTASGGMCIGAPYAPPMAAPPTSSTMPTTCVRHIPAI